jgi:hypothetical protein
MNYGTDLKLKRNMGSGEYGDHKSKERPGAAKGQGAGMDGYNAGAVNRAMESIKGGPGKPCYYSAGRKE